MTDLTVPPLVLAPAFAEDEGMRKGLRKPFPASLIGKLPKAGMKLDYVGHAAVTDRLNQIAPDWTFTLDPPYRDKEGVIVGVLGYMTIGGKTIPEVGAVDKRLPDGEAMKQAISDFVRRGAMRFGVALDLWSKEDLQDSAGSPEQADTSGRSKAGGRSERKRNPAQAAPTEPTEPREEGSDGPSASADVTGDPPPGPSGEEPGSAGGPDTAGPPSPVGFDPFASLGKLVELYHGDKAAVLKAAQALNSEVKSLPGIPPQTVMDLIRAKQEAT